MTAVRTALVTGAARGIGRGIALGLAGLGYDVVIQYRSSEQDAAETVRLIRELGVRAGMLRADLTRPDEAAGVVEAAHAAFLGDGGAGLGVLVNNVGNYVHKPLAELEIAEWHEMFDSNLHATYYTCRAALPFMRAARFGRIVNLGYAGAQHLLARPGILPYAIAKSGVIALTVAIAKTEAAHGITANVVSPGVIETSVSQPVREIPAGRLGTVQELSAEVLHFVQASDYVTGQITEVAGGWNL
ncbi:bifunctional dihydropteridine reductase/dihydrofolate reductase TmpR [Deinococcus aquiradiocola]|uniref:Bifunctional dihydropteridine reductase/dihydrofolate reductase TmpR n=1 Tax=Deinococcus aquiradiocola TaxID=393059 RepID=A0A917UPS3_9DEIO|nr:bifunctional dihydropteridine reductase/dihydrofolate reductase TmpR [Deinococcus aquiradiocola]GGJ73017.1 bifunctional dihydropteridine reductase/dihydrofolate reductase TmpR [Deinococcus aquiradiocola]